MNPVRDSQSMIPKLSTMEYKKSPRPFQRQNYVPLEVALAFASGYACLPAGRANLGAAYF